MLVPSLAGPFSAVYVLGVPTLLFLPLISIVLGVELGIGIQAGNPTLPEYICTSIAGVLLIACISLLAWVCLYRKVEVYFSTLPWLQYTQGLQARSEGRTYPTRCPWTGLRPTHRCRSCDCHVHSNAWHKADRFTGWLVGDTVLRWEPAKAALSYTDNPEKGRVHLDTALDFCGNVYTNSVAECCIGCAAWQKWLNVGTRLTLTLAFGAGFFIFAPWGFNSAYTSFWGVPLQVLTEVFSVCWAGAALLMQAKCVLRVNEFLLKHRNTIPTFQPLFELPPGSLLAWLTKHLAATPWEQKQ